jgi:RNA polymerase sigma factor (sigma-70 family)
MPAELVRPTKKARGIEKAETKAGSPCSILVDNAAERMWSVKERQFAGGSVIRGALAVRDDSDADLLGRFVTSRDETAFAALMARHGPMVFGVCRRLLRHTADAEDAFQATFLILARKAASIGKRELLANWLYGVAARVAARARLVALRHQTREIADMERVATASREPAKAPEFSAALDAEVQRLPVKYRGPVVLYYLQGRTNEEIAGEMHCPVNTIKTRLSRAREMLRKRLTRRGLAVSAGAFVAALSPEALASSLPPVLIDSTLRTAICFAAGDMAAGGVVSAQAAALTKGVLHTMFVTQMKTVATIVLALAVLLAGIGLFAHRSLTAEPAKKTDKENIQGVWKVASVKANGKESPDAELVKSATWTIGAEKVTVKGDQERKSTYKIDFSVTPKTIDITSQVEGAEKGQTFRGIYSLKEDTLKICCKLLPGGDRPREIASTADSGIMLIVLKRVKK